MKNSRKLPESSLSKTQIHGSDSSKSPKKAPCIIIEKAQNLKALISPKKLKKKWKCHEYL
jgi:hypothetical protein